MTHALELNHWGRPGRDTADRRHRSSRAAFDRILDQTSPAERQKAIDTLAAAARHHPGMMLEHRRIEAGRAHLSRRGELLAAGGALTIIGLVAGLCMTTAPLAAQAGGVLVGALGLVGFRLAIVEGRLLLGWQIVIQIFASLMLLLLAAAGTELAFLAAIACMGWAALGLRTLQLSAGRQLDIDEIELMLKAQGRQTVWAVREDRQRRMAAAI